VKLVVVAVMVWLALAPTWKSAEVGAAVQNVLAVELGGCRTAVEFLRELANFLVQRGAVGGRVGGVGRCTASSRDTLQDGARRAQRTFSRLRAARYRSLALRAAWLRPRICDVERSETAQAGRDRPWRY